MPCLLQVGQNLSHQSGCNTDLKVLTYNLKFHAALFPHADCCRGAETVCSPSFQAAPLPPAELLLCWRLTIFSANVRKLCPALDDNRLHYSLPLIACRIAAEAAMVHWDQ